MAFAIDLITMDAWQQSADEVLGSLYDSSAMDLGEGNVSRCFGWRLHARSAETVSHYGLFDD